ncbi:hypothetical protein AZ46_0210760 [Metabacillus indicus LMG 22858]|uniref:Uncharacterized protein n=1 Tax=Metabacillus indicus TaxID=246786 RepID=A0A084GWQ8_METID|nr:hypothetical protein AZ46_0210760 [Metabacillus indicus LMG 22858]KEZ51770.1 hypothetical protein GS18_0211665 [Metabacillus indicus]
MPFWGNLFWPRSWKAELDIRKAESPGQLRESDKEAAEKALFAFTDGSVLTEELGDGAGHHRKAEGPV